jgi:type IV secretory pathway TraG/TraD family ATPase VirD4
METQIFYRPGNQVTADYLERCLGRRSEYAHSQTLREGEETSQALSEQGVPLITAQEIKQLGDDDIIAFHRRLPPFKAKRMDWTQHPILSQRRSIEPPKLMQLPQLETTLPTTLWQRTKQSTYIDPDNLN